jgi:hypothetical protein
MDLDVTPERLALEAEAALAFQGWLKACVTEIRAELQKGFRSTWFKAGPGNVFEQGDRYGNRRPRIRAGEEVFGRILVKARDLGAKEAARALLKDQNPPRKYQFYTRNKLQALARKQVKLVDATTTRMVRHITSEGAPDNVDELLHKLYSAARCQGISIDQVSKGYIRGAAEVLRQNGYRYIYARTMRDERVCKVCRPNESRPFTVLQFLKLYPLHVRCRCYPSTTRFDGTRERALHVKSVMVDWEEAAVMRASWRRR